jgi:hypothetical protein
LKLIGKSQLLAEDFVFVLRNLLTVYNQPLVVFVRINFIYLYIYIQSLIKSLDNKAAHIVPL